MTHVAGIRFMRPSFRVCVLILTIGVFGCTGPADFDTVIEGGMVYDGSGSAPVRADVGIRGDSVAAVGDLSGARATSRIDATGMAVSPGFINMLSWSLETLIQDGRGLSDLMQGVTLEVFGEGSSGGPLSESMVEEALAAQSRIHYDITWRTLGEYMEFLQDRGVSPNVASFVGATDVRVHVLGYEDRPPTDEELGRMKALVREAMEEGALGVGASLIYAPAFYASTDELTALASVAAEYDGMYIAHVRNESDRLEEAIDEHLAIARGAGIRSEIYHLKAGGIENWPKMEQVLDRLERARAEGTEVSADMYTYTAGATGLDAAMPPWVQEGGYGAWRGRLTDPVTRSRVAAEMRARPDGWENLYRAAGAEGTLLADFRQDSLKYLVGKTLAEVASMWGTTPEEAAMDLVVADSSRVGTIYFIMSEDNVRRKIRTPWITFGSDAGAPAPEPPFTETNTHPRAYGNFARLLGRYVRDERLIPLEDAIHRLTALPASRLRIDRRGMLAPGFLADVVVFDPATIADHATFEQPHRLSTGVRHVWVNGQPVVSDGVHTGATPGRFVRRSAR